jgi:hypothetical protein
MDIKKVGVSSRVFLIYQLLNDLVEMHDESEEFARLIDNFDCPFHMSLDELSCEVFAWYERIKEEESTHEKK